VAVCAGVVAFCLMYVAVDYARLPHLFYYQLERVWRFETRATGSLPSGYVGLWTWAIGAGVVVGGAAAGITRRSRRPLGERGLTLALAWAATAFVLAAAYYGWNNRP
jgi:hypothetical protein